MQNTEIWVNKTNYRDTKIVKADVRDLSDGDIVVSIDKYGLTSNNVGYAVSGDMIGYWNYFPTGEDGWGIVTVWGMADVVASNNDAIKVGERIYGFFPMASHLVISAGNIKAGTFTDVAEHRSALPEFYNQYMRTEAEPDFLKLIEDERCIYFPLFMTGFVLADFLDDNKFFGADQVFIGSVSSKTGVGMANFLKGNEAFKGKLVGLTSAGNRDFVEGLGLCDQVATYDDLSSVDNSLKSVYVDMSGNGPFRKILHTLLGENMVSSHLVGATHWDSERSKEAIPGSQPEFFFTPAHIAKRDADWGNGVLMKKAYGASAQLAAQLKGSITIEPIKGAEAGVQIWLDMLDNKVSGSRGIMVSL